MAELVPKIFPICGCASANNIRKGLPCLRRVPESGDQCADHKNKGWVLSTVTVSEANTRQAPLYGVLSFHNGHWYIQRYKCSIIDCKKPRANFTKTCIVHSHANASRKDKRADINLVEDDDDGNDSSDSSSDSSSAESVPKVSKLTMKKSPLKNLPQKKRSHPDSKNKGDADADADADADVDADDGSIHDHTEIVRLKRQVSNLTRKVSSLTNHIDLLTNRMDHMEDKVAHSRISRSEPAPISNPPLPAFKIIKPPQPPTVVGVPFTALMSQPTPNASLSNVNELLDQEMAVRMARMQSSLDDFNQQNANVPAKPSVNNASAPNPTKQLTKESLFQLWQEFLNSKE